ncbi:MAG: ATP-dependent helicase [Methanosphaera sp.]|nr:ATP-dependent helicase [Methanosphaera sp.]
MISEEKYIELIENVLGITLEDNLDQKKSILSPVNENQYIVAGPGSGKTTVLVLKILKYIFVDNIKLENILVTTFTKKAARELKERISNWTLMLSEELGIGVDYDFDNLLIGTLDSIAEEIVSKHMDVEIIDNFTSSAIMMQNLLTDERNKDKRLKQFIKKIKNNQGGVSTSDINNQIQTIRERIYYDMINKEELKKDADREAIVFEIIDDYLDQLNSRNVMDYAMLEEKFYELLKNGLVDSFNDISVLLIDEYQDTNLLQEAIYFKIAEYVNKNNGNITVVGDDDQSLYRFRGATINLFTEYSERIKKELGVNPKTIFLHNNYRSTKAIIDFTNDYITLDEKFQESRTTDKPKIIPTKDTNEGLPVIGMFRNNLEELSTDLSELIYALKINKEYVVERHGKKYDISLKKTNPSIAVLNNSPKEINAFNKKRLPYYIRESLSYKDENITVFNPRGQSIETTEMVSLLCGLILQSIDPDAIIENNLDNIPPLTKKTLKSWRKYVREYMEESNKELLHFDEKVNMNELLEDIKEECELLSSDSSENMVYYDIILETIVQTDNAINDDGLLTVNQVFWHILVPIASGAIDIDDDMFDVDLEDNVNIMSIHQSKGLEFDVVVVDVGSDIFNNSSSTAFKRFPRNGGITHNLENYLKDYSTISYDYDKVSGLDKAFNDLIRRYFVAYTRAKSILILVGLNSMRYGYKGDFQDKIYIENVATGWSRDKKWHWDSLDNLLNI